MSPVSLQVEEAQYQPINASKRDGVQVLTSVGRLEETRGDRGSVRTPGNPWFVWVLIKTHGLYFMASIFFKLISDTLTFANPLILK